MRRFSIVAFALFASLLMITAMPAAASSHTQLVIGSEHTTDVDFNNGQMTNMQVSGSGTGASLVLQSDSYNVVDDSGDGAAESSRALAGDTGADDAFTTSFKTVPDFSGEITDIILNITTTTGTDYSFTVDIYAVQENPDGTFGEGTLIKNNWDPSFSTGEQSIKLDTPFSVSGGEAWTIEFVTSASNNDGAQDNIGLATDEDSGLTGWRSNQFDASGDGGGDVTLAGWPTPNTYTSATHDVEDAKQGVVDLTLSDARATVTWQENVGGTWTDIRSDSYTSSGAKTVDISAASSSQLRVVMTFERTGTNPVAELHDEGVKFTDHAPTVDNSSASPSGGAVVTESPVQLSINAGDREFGTAQGEQVTVTFYDASDDSVIGTDTLSSSNGTASVEWGGMGGGANQWYAVAEDSYGLQTTSDTFSFTAPEELRIYNESAPTQLVDNATVEIRFYFDDGDQEIVERNTTDGTITMTGLPVDEPFVVVADADGFVPRRIYVESLFESQRVYLLPDSEDYVEIGFELQDTTGEYPTEDSVLVVERGLNGTYQTVQGDFFGATGRWNAQLAYNERHRLTLLNTETGAREPLGAFTPTLSGTHVVRVTNDGAILTEDTDATARVEPNVRSIEATENATVAIQLLEGNESISSWSADLTVESENGTETVFSDSGSGNASLQPSFDLRGHGGGRLTVNVTWTTASGTTDMEIVEFSVREQFTNDYSLLSTLGSVSTLLPSTTADTVTSFFALIVTFLITATVASQLPVSTEVVGFVAVACLAAFSVIAWVSYDIVFVGCVTWICFASLRRGL